MDQQDQGQSQEGGNQGGGQEVDNGPEGNHAVHLGIETGRARNQAGDDQGQDHELEQPHEELSWIGDVVDRFQVQVKAPEEEAHDEATADTTEGDNQQQVVPQPLSQSAGGGLLDARLHLDAALV